jgi:hypothetical protein
MGPLGKAIGAGAGKSPALGLEEDEQLEEYSPEAEEEPESDLPPGFDAAFEEYSAAPTAQGLYDLIELCKSGGGKSPGLELILGGKGKKP